MAKSWTKADLYREVAKLRQKYDIDISDEKPVDAFSLANKICVNPQIKILPFNTSAICGMLYKGEKVTVIGLNARHNAAQQKNSCLHELLHYEWHDEIDKRRICKNMADTANDYVEWQANQGAAELMMPYMRYIPDFVRELTVPENYRTKQDFCFIPHILAAKYAATPLMAEYRINDLMYEIRQYIKGRPLEQLSIISHREQTRRAMHPGSFSGMVDSFERVREYFLRHFPPDTAAEREAGGGMQRLERMYWQKKRTKAIRRDS